MDHHETIHSCSGSRERETEYILIQTLHIGCDIKYYSEALHPITLIVFIAENTMFRTYLRGEYHIERLT